jgi:hypothetical protein
VVAGAVGRWNGREPEQTCHIPRQVSHPGHAVPPLADIAAQNAGQAAPRTEPSRGPPSGLNKGRAGRKDGYDAEGEDEAHRPKWNPKASINWAGCIPDIERRLRAPHLEREAKPRTSANRMLSSGATPLDSRPRIKARKKLSNL